MDGAKDRVERISHGDFRLEMTDFFAFDVFIDDGGPDAPAYRLHANEIDEFIPSLYNCSDDAGQEIMKHFKSKVQPYLRSHDGKASVVLLRRSWWARVTMACEEAKNLLSFCGKDGGRCPK